MARLHIGRMTPKLTQINPKKWPNEEKKDTPPQHIASASSHIIQPYRYVDFLKSTIDIYNIFNIDYGISREKHTTDMYKANAVGNVDVHLPLMLVGIVWLS